MMNQILGGLLVLGLATPAISAPRPDKIEGVPFNCVNVVRYELIRDFAAENPGDKDGIKEFRELIRSAPAYACRERKNRRVEHVTWCDGSGCTGATGTLKNGRCIVSDKWSGQDDGDIVEEAEHAKNCLTRSDF